MMPFASQFLPSVLLASLKTDYIISVYECLEMQQAHIVQHLDKQCHKVLKHKSHCGQPINSDMISGRVIWQSTVTLGNSLFSCSKSSIYGYRQRELGFYPVFYQLETSNHLLQPSQCKLQHAFRLTERCNVLGQFIHFSYQQNYICISNCKCVSSDVTCDARHTVFVHTITGILPCQTSDVQVHTLFGINDGKQFNNVLCMQKVPGLVPDISC